MHRGVRWWPAAEVHDTGGPWVGNKQHILETEHHGLQSNEQSAIVLGRKSRAGDHVRRPHIREQQQRSKRECPLPCNHPESARKANRWVFRPRISIQYNEYRRINEQFTTSYLTSRIDLNRWDRSSLAHYSPSTVCYAARPCIVELTRLSVFLLTLPMLYSFTLFPTLSSMSHTDTTSRGVHSLSSCSQHWSHHINLIDPALELRVHHFAQTFERPRLEIRLLTIQRARNERTLQHTRRWVFREPTLYTWDILGWFLSESGERHHVGEGFRGFNRRKDLASIFSYNC